MTTRSHTLNTRAIFQRADTVTWVGNSCGRHGSYIFYKAFRFHPSKPVSVTSSSALVRTRTRERRNTVGENDGVKSPVEKDEADPFQADTASEERIICLGEFFFVQCRPEDPVCVGELQLLWHDKHSGQDLSSTRLYYLPETTPAGRTAQHGEDEVLAVSEKVVMRTNDLASWVVDPHEWDYGTTLPSYKSSPLSKLKQPMSTCMQRYSQLRACVNMNDVEVEKQMLMIENLCPEHRNFVKMQFGEKLEQFSRGPSPGIEMQKSISSVEEQKPSIVCCTKCASRQQKAQVMVLSLTSYCRHKAVMRRLDGSKLNWLGAPGASRLLSSLGAYTSDNPKMRIVFCRDSFDYSQLFEHDLICEEFAPVFKGRPRKKAKKTGNHVHSKGTGKRANTSEQNGNNVENQDPNLDKVEDAAKTNRRRIKRKNLQRSYYDQGFVSTPSLSRLKRSRRGHARTPTPIGATAREKSTSSGASKSEPTSPSDQGQEGVGRRRSKRRPRTRPTDLSIALRNSLLENHKVSEIEAKQTQRPSSSASSSSGSSRSASPSDGITLNEGQKLPSPTGSSSSDSSGPSDTRDAQGLSDATSPIDYSALTPPDANARKDLDLTSETNMYLRGLSEGHLPENKSEFLDLLYQFMRKRNTPIGRIPSLGFKKLDLWTFFKLSQEYGGYDMVTAKRLWKHVYDRMGGNPSCTSAATCTRKHFEKLLLPLEEYLRQTVAKIKTEETSNTNKNETSTNLNALNGRTFDGDVYFHNSAKISIPSSTLDGQKLPQSEASPTELTASSMPTSNSTIVTTSSDSKSAVASSTTSFLSNGFSLESLVHNVVRSQMLADCNQKTKSSSEQLEKVKKIDGNSDASVELIDLTEGSGKSPTSVHRLGANSKVPSYSKPPTLHVPLKPLVFTRTHCPRISNVPPPFIPKSSTPKLEVPPKHIPNDKKRSIPSYLDLPRMQKEAFAREEDKTQKLSSHNASPPSPKRTRDSSLLNHTLPSNRPYHISNLVSTNEKPLLRHDRPIGNEYVKTTSTSEFHPFKNSKIEIPPSKVPGFDSQNRSSTFSNNALRASRVATLEQRERLVPSETNRFSAKHTPTVSEAFRHLPTRSESNQNSILERSMRFTENKSPQRTYYRPTGMLASYHRDRQQQAKSTTGSLPNGIVKDEKPPLTMDDQHIMTSRIRATATTLSEGIPLKKDFSIGSSQTKNSPMLMTQQLPKKEAPPRPSFSSSFTVDRLTSDTNKRPPITSAPRVVHKDETRHSRPLASTSYTSVPRYVDPQQLPYKQTSEKEPYRAPSGLSANDSSRFERSRWNPSSQSYNGIKQSLSSSVASSSSDELSSSASRRMLDSVPPQLAAIMRSQLPSDGPAVQTIDQQLLKSLPASIPAATSLPQTIPGISFPSQSHVLPEFLLRSDPSLLRASADQQAAIASELTRAALLQSSLPASGDPLALMRMYEALAYAQLVANPLVLQDPVAFAAGLGGARTAAKPPGHSNILRQHVRAPINLPQAPILVTRPQQRSTDATPVISYPYARR